MVSEPSLPYGPPPRVDPEVALEGMMGVLISPSPPLMVRPRNQPCGHPSGFLKGNPYWFLSS